MFRNIVSIFLVVVVLLAVVVNSGCYGPCKLSSGVTKWHAGIQTNKYVKELVFLPIFFFVYPITGFVDYIILNSIEYWTGEDPLPSE